MNADKLLVTADLMTAPDVHTYFPIQVWECVSVCGNILATQWMAVAAIRELTLANADQLRPVLTKIDQIWPVQANTAWTWLALARIDQHLPAYCKRWVVHVKPHHCCIWLNILWIPISSIVSSRICLTLSDEGSDRSSLFVLSMISDSVAWPRSAC